MKKLTQFAKENSAVLLWISVIALFFGLLFARAAAAEMTWLTIVLSVLLLVALGGLVHQNRRALKTRSVAFGLNSLITVILVICILGVLNFLVSRYPSKLDLTKNKIHTLSDQTEKVVSGLKKDVKAVYFAKLAQRDQAKPLLESLEGLNPKFDVEYVDPDKEPARAKAAGIKKYGTLQLLVGERSSTVDELNEEKVTNALIKLLKDKQQTLCSISGHGEKDFESKEADGYAAVKQAMEGQAYIVKTVNLPQDGKIPADCTAIAILGPTKAFFKPEIETIKKYLADGGRALIAVDLNLRGSAYAPELLDVLSDWYIGTKDALIVDPLSRMLGVDAAVPIVATYSKDHPITKGFEINSFFAFARPLEEKKGAPAGLHVEWLGRTTPKSWGETDVAGLGKGRVSVDPGKDLIGPLTVAFAVEGKQKDSKAKTNTRLVAFGTSAFATNNFARYGGNLDLFMNAASWVMQDESLISIRSKEEESGRLEMTAEQANVIFLVTIVVLPLVVMISGIVVWVRRRKL